MGDENLAESIPDFDRRKPLVEQKLGGAPQTLIICGNVDQSGVPDRLKGKVHTPTTEDTLTRCQVCRDQVWIGPRQRPVQSMGIRICQLCLGVAQVLDVIAAEDTDVMFLGRGPLGIPRTSPPRRPK